MLLSRTSNDVSTLDPVYGQTLLHISAMNLNSQEVLNEMLKRKVDLECLNRAAATRLHVAIDCQNITVVKLLVKAGANTKSATGTPRVLPLHQAVQTGNLPIVRELIQSGADNNASLADTKMTALHYACQKDRWDIISFLIESHAFLEERDICGRTPYLVAAQSKNWRVVRKFFTTCADLNVKSNQGFNALHYTVLGGSMSTVKFLEERAPVQNEVPIDSKGSDWGSTLALAIDSGNENLVQRFWQDGAEKYVTRYGFGLCHFALRDASDKIRNFLLAKCINCDLDLADLSKRANLLAQLQCFCRPIHIASFYGLDPAIVFLKNNNLISNINVLTLGAEGYSPQHLAAMNGCVNTVKLLKKYGADLDLKSN